MSLDLLRQALALDRTQLRARPALPCMLTIAAALGVGLALHRPVIGMIAAGGAMTVGFGSFQQVGHSRVMPMMWATIGMTLATAGGSAVGHSGPGAMLNAGAVGFIAGLLLALGPGEAWVAQQCAVAALVAAGYPTGTNVALSRGALLLAGGLVQTGVVVTFWHYHSPWKIPEAEDLYQGVIPALRTLRGHLSLRSLSLRFALRQGVTLALAAGLAHYARLPNGYWVPMTALLVMKPSFEQTIVRGLARIGGTLIGAVPTTWFVEQLHPSVFVLAVLIVAFAWAAYSIVLVNYVAFSIALTAYIVVLLAFAGLSAHAVLFYRTLNTTLGGGLAFLSYVTSLWYFRGILATPAPAPNPPAASTEA